MGYVLDTATYLVLRKLTLFTGMNCLVPGQDGDDLTWFWGITGGLLVFGLSCAFIAKKVVGVL